MQQLKDNGNKNVYCLKMKELDKLTNTLLTSLTDLCWLSREVVKIIYKAAILNGYERMTSEWGHVNFHCKNGITIAD